MTFIIEEAKENISDLYKGTVRLLQVYFSLI